MGFCFDFFGSKIQLKIGILAHHYKSEADQKSDQKDSQANSDGP